MHSTPLRVLCIEDDPGDEVLVRLAVRRLPRPVQWLTALGEEEVSMALDQGVDLVLSDYHLEGYTPLRAIAAIASRGLDIPLVVVSNAVGEAAAVEVLRAGAADYVSKDRLAILPMVMARVLEAREQRERQRALLAQNQRSAMRLRQLATELVQAQENERRRLAQALHDSLGQALTALQLHLYAADAASDDDESRDLRQKAYAILRDTIGQMRTLSFAVRPAQLDHQGLVATIETMAQQMLAPMGVAFALRVRGSEGTRGSAQSSIAFRVVQEAFTNAMRHAAPRHMAVHLGFRTDGRQVVAVGDDGAGLPESVPGPPEAGSGGRGLSGMAERCELSGGFLRLRSRPGAGTVLRATLGASL
jgi:signal transduction histidine kinase